jgi:predicted metal-binding membrane protein
LRRSLRAPLAVPVTGALLGAALVAWIVTVERMRGMDAGPGTDLGALGWFLGVWVTMMAAMMLPSAAPMVRVFHRVSGDRADHDSAPAPISTWLFVAGYLASWTAYGLGAYGAYRAVTALDPGFLAWDREGPLVAGFAIATAGLYQLTPLKQVCLRHCRTPLHFVMHRWRDGGAGAFAMGLEHGLWCLGCCWGLMLVLFALGVMSITWMAAVAVLVFAEKVLPVGERLSAAVAVCLIGLGAWVAVAPASVPGFTEPASMPAMHMGVGTIAPPV